MTKDDFYSPTVIGQSRKKSRELDFGVWWRNQWNYPNFRVTWVENTGEVISVSMANEDISIIGHADSEEEIEEKLKGWAEECGKLDSLQWVRERVK